MFYIFHGPDDLSRTETLKAFKAQMGDPAMADLNTTLLDGDAVTLGELREACDTLPFLSDRRLVIVTGYLTRPEKDPKREKRRRQADKATLDNLTGYLDTLADTTRLIFVEQETLPVSHPIVKLAEKRQDGHVRAFGVPGKRDLPGWIEQRVRLKEASIERTAAGALAEAVGDDTRLLDSEIEKLVTYVGDPETTITSAHVDLLVPYTGLPNVFIMVDAIGRQDGRVALRMLHKLLDENPEPGYPLYLLTMIVRQFRILIQVKEMSAQGLAVSTIAKRAGLKNFVADKTKRQSLNFTMGQLEAIYGRLLNTDLSIKTGKMDGVLALDTLVAALCAQE
jgi:DNA polymerase-3 subunit delta